MRTDKRMKRQADRQTEAGRQARRHNEALIVDFRNFAIAPKTGNNFLEFSVFVF